MKKNLLIITWSILMLHKVNAQSKTGMENYSFLSTGQTYVWMPIVHHVSKTGFYTEMRYNYEALQTGSLYMGKSFSKKGAVNYTITPMLGIVAGEFNGGAIAMNMDVTIKKIAASIQTQYTINKDTAKNNFFFNWSELTYQPQRWFYAGISTQQTIVNKERLMSEYGILAALIIKKLTIPVYVFNPLSKTQNFIIGVNAMW